MWPLGQSFGSDSFSFFSLHCKRGRRGHSPNVRSCWQKLKCRTTSGYEYRSYLYPTNNKGGKNSPLTLEPRLSFTSASMRLPRRKRSRMWEALDAQDALLAQDAALQALHQGNWPPSRSKYTNAALQSFSAMWTWSRFAGYPSRLRIAALWPQSHRSRSAPRSRTRLEHVDG